MKNPFLTPADFWQERDFGAKISATFEFIGAHFKPLLKCLVYFVLPVSLLMGIGLGMFNNASYNLLGKSFAAQRAGLPSPMAGALGTSPFGAFNFSGLAIGMLGAVLAYLMLSGTVLGFVRARLRLPATEPVTPAQTWAELKARLGRVALAMLLLFVLSIVVFAVLVGSVVSMQAHPGLVFLLFFFLSIPALYAGMVMSLYIPVLWLEDLSIVASIGRCFQLIRGQWWATLGLLLVAGIIQSTLSVVFIIPQYAVMIGKALQIPGLDSDALGIVTNCLYAVGAIFTYSISILATTFQYFNLVEHKEGVGLRLLVDKLGTPQAAIPSVESSFYRPDDEGEY